MNKIIKSWFLKIDGTFCLFLFFLFCSNLLAQPDTSFIATINQYFKKISSKPYYIVNQPFIEFNYGYSTMNSLNIDEKLSNVYLGEFVYGFTQIDSNYEYLDIFKLNSQSMFLSDLSSHFKPKTIGDAGSTSDCWRFGFSHTSGWGWMLGHNMLTLQHTGSFVFSHIDFELPAKNSETQNELNLYDSDIKFGTATGFGLNYRVYDILHFYTGYEHTIVFPRFMAWRWLGSHTIELAMEKLVDIFEEKLLERYRYYQPIFYFVMKNAISLGFYQLRRQNMNWPFRTAAPVNYDIFKIGITLVF